MKDIIVLLVEDTEAATRRFRGFFKNEREFQIEAVPNTGAAHRRLTDKSQDPIDCVVTNLVLEGSVEEGWNFISCIHQAFPELPIIVWTKSPPEDITPALDRGARMGIEKYCEKERDVFPYLIRKMVPVS